MLRFTLHENAHVHATRLRRLRAELLHGLTGSEQRWQSDFLPEGDILLAEFLDLTRLGEAPTPELANSL